MTEFSNQFSRRKFLLTVGASAVGSVLLKGCLGNPLISPTRLKYSKLWLPTLAQNKHRKLLGSSWDISQS